VGYCSSGLLFANTLNLDKKLYVGAEQDEVLLGEGHGHAVLIDGAIEGHVDICIIQIWQRFERVRDQCFVVDKRDLMRSSHCTFGQELGKIKENRFKNSFDINL
jgi:hypothetical protein